MFINILFANLFQNNYMNSAWKLLQKKMNGNFNDPKVREIIYFKKNDKITLKWVWKYPPMHKAAMENKYTKVNKL